LIGTQLEIGLCFAGDHGLRVMVLRDVSKRTSINYVSTIQTLCEKISERKLKLSLCKNMKIAVW
jgi:hypothetical protein